METSLPGVDDIRAAMEPLTLADLETLAAASGVPATTLYKIKRGETTNPGIETVRKFLPYLADLRGAKAAAIGARSA